MAEVYKIFKAKKKDFVYKRDGKGRLATWAKDLVSKDHGTSVMSFRKREAEKSKFPLVFWET